MNESFKNPVEKLVATLKYKGVDFELFERPEVLWVGSVDYANNNKDESDINATLNRHGKLKGDVPKKDLINPDCWAALSINYTTDKKPCGVMFGHETYSDNQDKRYEMYTQAGGLWLRVACTKEASLALFGEENAETYRYFANNRLRNAAEENGYKQNFDILLEYEYYSPNVNYAYIPVVKKMI